jgi:hypothetical protein
MGQYCALKKLLAETTLDTLMLKVGLRRKTHRYVSTEPDDLCD